MNTCINRVLLAFITLFALVIAPAAAEEARDGDRRLRVGLALGGGGARGAAHIGVLKELERLRIPIDAIAGTSMGAIVGGLYAAGRSPAELETLVDSVDWADAFDDQSQRSHRRFREKEDDAAFSIPLELGLRDGRLQLPEGLIQGQKLSLILREQLLDVYDIDDFNQLPTPFRAVASDIETGEAFVMAGGDLELALRASMSAPGIFAPVTVDGHRLVDGGLVGNVPVSVVREMDVDIIIAVDVEFPLYPPEDLTSALAITEQMLTILIRKETLRELALLGDDDFLIRPDMGEYASTNFGEIGEVIAPGVAAARSQAGDLSALSISGEAYREHLAGRQSRVRGPDTIDFVRVVDRASRPGNALAAQLKTGPGDPVQPGTLADDAEYLYGLERFEQVSYQIVEENGSTGVIFNTRPKSWGPNYLRFGLSLEDDFEGSTAVNVRARMNRTGLNASGAEWRSDLQVGTDPQLDSEFYQPFGRDSSFFVAPSISFAQTNLGTFDEDHRIARYRIGEIEAVVDLGRALGRWGEVRAGVFRGGGKARLKVGDPELDNFDFASGGARLRFATDTFDEAQLPTEGTRFELDWRLSRPGFGADGDFDTVEAAVDKAWSFGRNTLRFGLEMQTTVRSDDLVQNFFPLGGFLRLSGLERGEISGPHAGLARLLYYRKVDETGGGLFDMPLYFGASIEAGNVWQSRDEIDAGSLLFNGSVFAGLDTYVGPLFMAAGFAENGDTSFYLFLGDPRRR